MKCSLALSNPARLAAESMPAPGDDDELGDAVSGLEGLHHGDERGGLGPITFPAPYLEGEPALVDQQPDDDLEVDPTPDAPWSNPPASGRPHPRPQEYKGGHARQARGQALGGGDVIEQSPREALPVAALLGPGQGAEQGPHGDRL